MPKDEFERPEISDWDEEDNMNEQYNRQCYPFGCYPRQRCYPHEDCYPRESCYPRQFCPPREFCRPRAECYPQ